MSDRSSDTLVGDNGKGNGFGRRRLWLRVLGSALVLVTGLQLIVWTEPLSIFGVLEYIAPNVVWRVKTEVPVVGLSFDDGPHPRHTPQVLEILRAFEAKATFFVVGERVQDHPEVMAQIRASGHEVGNHHFTEGIVLGQRKPEFLASLQETESAAQIEGAMKLFRPPSGLAWPWQLRLAQEKGYTCVLGNAYPYDPVRPPVWYMEWLVAKNLRPGSIVILHDGIPNVARTLEALPAILAAGQARGFRFVTIGSLLKLAKAPANRLNDS